MTQREIVGPQERFERKGAERLRDIRPFTIRAFSALMGEASGIVLAGAAMAMFVEPALVNFVVPVSLLYSWLVMSRRVTLPLRLPQTARRRDWNYPSPVGRRPRMAAGSIYLGNDLKGRELWISSEDGRQHATVPGTTGAGKTTALLSFLANALAHGSGFVLVDGKADNRLYGKVLALARRFGREDDVLCLNFMVASGVKDSNTFNPFAVGNADAIGEMLSSQLGDQRQNDPNQVFRDRAVALVGTIAPVLVWLRDHKGIALNIETIRLAIELRWIWKLAMKRVFEVSERRDRRDDRHPGPGTCPRTSSVRSRPISANCRPTTLTLDWNKQKAEEPSKQHGFAQFYFTRTFDSARGLARPHLPGRAIGDIDMRDVVLNRRILVVNLPALENSDATLAALGKLVVASLRGMMAQMLGASPRGRLQRSSPTSRAWAPRPSLSCSTSSPITRPAASTACSRWGAASISASCSASRRCRASGRGSAKRRLPARQRQSHDRDAPTGRGTHARMDRGDGRQDLRHAGDLLSRWRTGRLSRGRSAEVRPVSRSTGRTCKA